MFDYLRYQWNLGMFDLYLRQLIDLSRDRDNDGLQRVLAKAEKSGRRALELSEMVLPDASDSIRNALDRLKEYK